jgi:hypothetical protein
MSDAIPIIIAEWPKNGRGNIRVSLGKFQANHTIDLLLWYSAEDGTLRPGNKGITVSVKHVRQLANASPRPSGARANSACSTRETRHDRSRLPPAAVRHPRRPALGR